MNPVLTTAESLISNRSRTKWGGSMPSKPTGITFMHRLKGAWEVLMGRCAAVAWI